jgi:enoyl-CoA hydratase
VQNDSGAHAPLLTIDGARATIRLRRPDRHNALGADDIATLVAHLAAVEAQSAVRVLIFVADGRTFCAGYDLDALGAAQETGSAPHAVAFGAMVERIARLRVPTIAALSGSVYGGGTDLALACDLRIGIPGIELRMTAARIGVQYYAGGLQRFVRRLGLGAAKRIFLAAETHKSDELLRIGYLDELVASEGLAACIDALATALATNAPRAVTAMKRALDGIAEGAADASAIDRAFAASLVSPEVGEGLSAYRERRDPRFTDADG